MDKLSGQDLPYSNRELTEMFTRADERADTFHNKLMERMDVFESNTSTTLQSIEVQTKKTNGSVADLNRWRERINGGAIVAGIFMTIVVIPILGWAIYTLANLPTAIDTSVNNALSVYDINR